jgi:hypothetical protein
MYKDIKLKPSVGYTNITINVYNNIIRHILLKNSVGYGVKSVLIEENTSEEGNNQIANIFEQIPFKKEGVYKLNKTNTTKILGLDLMGSENGCYNSLIIYEQTKPFNLQLELQVIANTGKVHIKYCPVRLLKQQDNMLVISSLDYKSWQQYKEEILSYL